jgi:hypothetical protein
VTLKSDSWFLIIHRAFDPVKTFRLGKRIFLYSGIGGGILAVLVPFSVYQYISLRHQNTRLRDEVSQLKVQVSDLSQKLSQAAAEAHPPLQVEEMQVVREPRRAGFVGRFWLVQANLQKTPYAGTVAMVAKNESLRPPAYRVIPAEMRMEKGIPQQPEKGKPFEVLGRKFVEAFFDAAPEEVFQMLTVFIFSKEGKLILQKSAAIPKP